MTNSMASLSSAGSGPRRDTYADSATRPSTRCDSASKYSFWTIALERAESLVLYQRRKEDCGVTVSSPSLTVKREGYALKRFTKFFAAATIASSSILAPFGIAKADYQGAPRTFLFNPAIDVCIKDTSKF